ncbi:hypothetical protein [Aeribacillus sp. FSL k6-2211]|uniref:hypothetical protein n=1 Tax=Aeribacillus sp. FSL k6-2211 TaxID=2954608 RepID=UPI0030CD6C41
MTELLVGLIIGIFIMFIVVNINKTKKKRSLKLVQEAVPTELACRIPEGLPIISRLEDSLNSEYMEKVKKRVLANHPNWTETDFNWRLFELKRYFLLAGILKSVPMFSDEVDEIWHEMIMFTKEYENFSKKFFGSFLHHSPNVERTPIPHERALFDWMYLHLFEIYPNSTKLWGGFLKNPLSKTFLEEVRSASDEKLFDKYFRSFDPIKPLQTKLLEQLKNDIEKAEEMKRQNKSLRKKIKTDDTYSMLLPAMVFLSLYEQDSYTEKMSQLLNKDAGTSGGSIYACGAALSDSNDHSGGSGCSSSGCSSSNCGSSCGGGCGSS